MRIKISVLITVFCLLSLLVLPSDGAKPLPRFTVPNGFGVNIHFTGDPKDLDMIADAGFQFIRMDLTWAGVERKKGVYNFDRPGYDALTEGCTKRGIRILYILDYSNKLYETDRSVRTEEGRKAFAAFAEAAAKRYRGQGILWEIWNEPNLEHFWKPQPGVDDYCKLVDLSAGRIKKADPSGLVVAPATSGIPFQWLEQCFQKGLLQWIDVISVHPYRSPPPETVIKDYDKLRELIKRHTPINKKIPIISGEWGYSNVNWNKKPLTNETQGQYLVRMFLINLYQKIPVSIWYDWKNDGANPREREHNFGAVTHDLKPKTAYLAVSILSKTLNGYSIKKRLDLGNDSDYAFLMTKGNNQAFALWTMDKKHKIKLPVNPGTGTLISMIGDTQEIAWQSENLTLEISPSPQYLLIKDSL